MSLKQDTKAGYQGKFDAMRALAEKLMGKGGHAKDVNLSKDNMNIPYMRPYKEGGMVERDSRQQVANMEYDRKKKDAERFQQKEHKDYNMIKHRDQEDYEKRKKYDEAKEHKDHEAYEHMKQANPMMDKMMADPAFKKGGCVKTGNQKKDIPHKKLQLKTQHFAAGGVAKIRHNEATSKGAPKSQCKGNLRSVYY